MKKACSVDRELYIRSQLDLNVIPYISAKTIMANVQVSEADVKEVGTDLQ